MRAYGQNNGRWDAYYHLHPRIQKFDEYLYGGKYEARGILFLKKKWQPLGVRVLIGLVIAQSRASEYESECCNVKVAYLINGKTHPVMNENGSNPVP